MREEQLSYLWYVRSEAWVRGGTLVTVDADAPDPAPRGLDETVILLVSMDATNPSVLSVGRSESRRGVCFKIGVDLSRIKMFDL
jgi:hypothetical protein